MRFRLVHKLTSYLLAGTALATLATCESASWVSLVVLTVAAALSWFVEPDTRLGTLFDRAVPLFNLATVAFFALAMVGWVSRLDMLTCSIRAAGGAAIVFLLTRIVIRLVIGILARAMSSPRGAKGYSGRESPPSFGARVAPGQGKEG